MIVKNEDHVIRRCLASVLPFITHWVIVDTGSTDGTQASIRSFLQERHVPGELFERPWKDFAHNRSESLAYAAPRAEYLLIIDADEYLESDPGFVLPPLTADVYNFELVSGPFTYRKMQLLRAEAGWRYVGVVHEHLVADRAYTEERLPGLRTVRIMDGARSRDPMTYRRDALLLEEALLHDPGNARSLFYLAQSYGDAKEFDLAIDRYSRRVDMGGWAEEVWCSLYQIAKLREFKGEAWPTVQQAFLETFSFRPLRAEPLFRIGAHYQAKREFSLAHLFFSRAMTIPFPTEEVLYVEREVYRFLLPLEYSVACFYVGRHADAIRTANRMLAEATLSPEQQDLVIRNRQYSLDALYPPGGEAGEPDAVEGAAGAGVLVVVLCGEAEVWIEACVGSLRAQDHDFRALFIQDAGSDSAGLTRALDGTPFVLKRTEPNASWADCLRFAAEEAHPGDLLLLLDFPAVLADRRSLTDLVRHFVRYGCALMYGQFRRADGTLGNAMPLASPEDLRDGDLPSMARPLAFRKELLDEQTLPSDATPLTLLRLAGYDRIRFSDRPFALHLA